MMTVADTSGFDSFRWLFPNGDPDDDNMIKNKYGGTELLDEYGCVLRSGSASIFPELISWIFTSP
jgi:hypothetical protein